MTNKQIASLFRELADIMEIAGENQFKIRAYRKSAEIIPSLSEEISSMPRERLREIPGIGKAIAEKIEAAGKDDTFPTLEKWRQTRYAEFLPLLEIPGLKPRKIQGMIRDLGVSSIDDLRSAVRDGRLDGYKKVENEIKRKLCEFVNKNGS